MSRLCPRDGVYLFLDRTQRDARIVSCFLLDTPDGFSARDRATLTARLRAAFVASPQMHSRLVHVPLDLGYPYWSPVEPSYELSRHLTVHPSPRSWSGATAEIAEIAAHPLDTTRPLWQVDVLPDVLGAPGNAGRVTVVAASFHHAAFDGAGFLGMCFEHLVDAPGGAGPTEIPDLPSGAGGVPTRFRMAVDSAISLPGSLVRFGWALLLVLTENRRRRPAVAPPRPPARTRFAVHAHHLRTADFVALDRRDAEKVRELVSGATLNDVMLSVVSAAVCSYLGQIGEAPRDPLTIAVPVALRRSSADTRNAFAPMIVDVPPDGSVRDRLSAVVGRTRRAKQTVRSSGQARDSKQRLLGATPAPVMACVGAALARRRPSSVRNAPADMVVSSVPIPQTGYSICGHEVTGRTAVQSLTAPALAHYWTPLSDQILLSVTADSAVLPDLGRYLVALASSFAEHVAAARAQTGTPA